MTLLTVGVLLWCLLHVIPAGMSGPRQSLIDTLGEAAYKTGFSVLMLSAVGMMIWGWRGATPSMIYAAPVALRPVAVGLTVLGFVLMAAANHPTRIGRFVRHPQLTGVLLWGLAHLLANGDSRSIVLFGGLSAWCLLMIVLINRRDGPWEKPEPPSWLAEMIGVAIGLLVAALMMWAHPWLAGVPVIY